jgi:hypothetical protein
MKYMVARKIAPNNIKATAEAFLKGGAPTPKGLTMLCRWHVPGCAYGWAVVEGNDPTAVAQHVAEWEHFLGFQITPVMEDAGAGKALASVYGKSRPGRGVDRLVKSVGGLSRFPLRQRLPPLRIPHR